MVKRFNHKGLKQLFETGNTRGINFDHTDKLFRILDRLDASASPRDMNLPAYKLHQLKGENKGIWSVWVSGNWRVTFRFEKGNAVAADYRDYH